MMCCMWTSTQSSNLPMLLPLNDSFNSVIPSCKACSSKAFLSKKRNRIKSAKQLTALFWGSAVRILPFYSRVWSSKPDDVLKCKWITIIFPNIYVCNIISWSYMAHLSILCSVEFFAKLFECRGSWVESSVSLPFTILHQQ